MGDDVVRRSDGSGNRIEPGRVDECPVTFKRDPSERALYDLRRGPEFIQKD